MAHARMVDAFVRDLLNDFFDGDVEGEGPRYRLPLPVRPVVQVVPGAGNGLRVQITTSVAHDVASGPDLFAALNDANAQLPYGRLFVVDGRVLMEETVLGETVDEESLDNAIRVVAWAARRFGEPLAAAGGGTPALDLEPTAADDAAAASGLAAGPPADGELRLGPASEGIAEVAPPVTGPLTVNAAGYL